MQRKRDTSQWNPTHYRDVDEFLTSRILTGAHAIAHRGRFIDLLIEDRGAPTTLIVFHSALTGKVRTLPAFSGRNLAAMTGLNLIAVADPSIEMGDIDLAWYLGNRDQGPLVPTVAPLLKHALNELRTARALLFGASGGGYAAGLFAQEFPNCIAVLANPRLDFSAKPLPPMERYLKVCHRVKSATPMRRIRSEYVTDRLLDSLPRPLNFDLLILQNEGDSTYWTNQFIPFAEDLVSDPRFAVRTLYYGDGHKPVPSDLLTEILGTLGRWAPRAHATTAAGFSRFTG